MSRMNAFWNCKNPNQGIFPKVLCVCSAGLLRSPTIAWVLSNRGYNTRAAGTYDYALIPVDEVLLEWADHIMFADQEHYKALSNKFEIVKPYEILNIPDNYEFRDAELVRIVEGKLTEKGFV